MEPSADLEHSVVVVVVPRSHQRRSQHQVVDGFGRFLVPFSSYRFSWIDGVEHLSLDGPVFLVVAVPSAPHSSQHDYSVNRMVPHIVEGFVRRQPFIHCVSFSLQDIEGL